MLSLFPGEIPVEIRRPNSRLPIEAHSPTRVEGETWLKPWLRPRSCVPGTQRGTEVTLVRQLRFSKYGPPASPRPGRADCNSSWGAETRINTAEAVMALE